MDPLEIKIEPPEFVVDVYHIVNNFKKNDNTNENQENENDPLELNIEPSKLVNDDFHYLNENGVKNGNLENGDFSSEQTLNSVSFSLIHSNL